jgi:hypothetical protein
VYKSEFGSGTCDDHHVRIRHCVHACWFTKHKRRRAGATGGSLTIRLKTYDSAMDQRLLPETTSDVDAQPSPRPFKEITSLDAAKIVVGSLMILCTFVLAAVTLVALLHRAYVDITDPSRRPEIFAAVDGSSGLDARAPRAFNLTVAVDNLGGKYNVCVGGDAVVLYGGVPLATGLVQDTCVPPHGSGEVAVHAACVGAPTELAALMAEDMERSGAVLQLKARVLSVDLTSLICTANLRGGEAPAASPTHRACN